MSIISYGDDGSTSDSNDASLDTWCGHPESFFDPWDPLFPSLSILWSIEAHVNWRETPRDHVFRVVFPMHAKVGVLVYIDDEDVLQIGTEDGKFASQFQLPEDAQWDGVRASIDSGVLTIIIPKVGASGDGARRWNVEITGSE